MTDSGGGRRRAIREISLDAAGEHGEAGDQVDVGANMLAGASAIEMLEATKQMLPQGDGWKNPFGYGQAINFIMT